METLSLLKAILAEIASEEQKLSKKRLVAEFLQERLKEEGSYRPADSVVEVLRMPVHAGGGNSSMPQEGFSEHVLKAVQELYHREFTASDVFAIMVDKGVQFNSSTPKASISTALGRLVSTGLLRLAHKGAGKTPHRFTRATIPTEDDLRREGEL